MYSVYTDCLPINKIHCARHNRGPEHKLERLSQGSLSDREDGTLETKNGELPGKVAFFLGFKGEE
jgi:hypothetical protein